MNVVSRQRMDKASFFAWTDRQERKFELADGVVVMMANVTRHHARICTNVVAALLARLDRGQYDITQGDFAIETGEQSVRYADVMVEPFGAVGADRSTLSALLLVEVLSPSSMHVDFHEKLHEYQAIPALGTYIICAQDSRRAWAWTREGGAWPKEPQIFETADALIDVPALGIKLPLAEIYSGLDVR